MKRVAVSPLHTFLLSSAIFLWYGVFTIGFLSRGVAPQKIVKNVTVNWRGGADFKTLQAAIDSVPDNNKQWIKIHIKPGVYYEKVIIPMSKSFIYLEGQEREYTVVSYDDHVEDSSDLMMASPAQRFTQSVTTETSATFSVYADNFVAKGITFRNNFGLVKPVNRSQAVAASVSGDKSSFHECAFIGVQDTLLDYHGRHLFNSCYIEGATDFIFGFAQSIYKNCTINVQASTHSVSVGYVTAHGRMSPDSTGFVFVGGSIDGAGQTLLGRAWGNHSRTMFVGTGMSRIVHPRGWDQWNVNPPSHIYFAEFNCSGAGSNLGQRVPWEVHPKESEVARFVSLTYIDGEGWLSHHPYGS